MPLSGFDRSLNAMKTGLAPFTALLVGLTGCDPTAAPRLSDHLVGRWQAQVSHHVETDAAGRVLLERTDSAGYGLEFTRTHQRFYYTTDWSDVSEQEPYSLRGAELVSATPETPYQITVVNVSPARLVLRQVTSGLNSTKMTSTITFARVD